MSWRRLQHVFSVTIFCLPRRLKDVLKRFSWCLEDVLEDEKLLRWRRLESSWGHSSKTSWKHALKMSWRNAPLVTKMSVGVFFQRNLRWLLLKLMQIIIEFVKTKKLSVSWKMFNIEFKLSKFLSTRSKAFGCGEMIKLMLRAIRYEPFDMKKKNWSTA